MFILILLLFQVRNVIKEVKRYEGEPTGINAHVVKSIKFK